MTTLYNFSLEDIETDFDKCGENPQHYVLKAGEITEFEDHIAQLLEEKLVERELWKHPPSNKNYEKKRQELRELTRVK